MSDLQELQTRESDLNSTIKKLTGVTADFASETEDLLATLRNQRAEQKVFEFFKLTKPPVRYDRRGTDSQKESNPSDYDDIYRRGDGVKLSDVVVLKTKIETKLKKKRQIDIALSYARLKEEIRRNLSEGIPRPNPIDKLSLRVKGQCLLL
ncbi:hypothetical protein EB796_019107 [Bugula neritina]|uniref:Uncharacterized protein n=1 Tax=Bugula neritina TaxID=10212 RepID=A0A7J7J8N5_BUGNE|nr:hypothetical protein EB796_019107 [Bugula neritina]